MHSIDIVLVHRYLSTVLETLALLANGLLFYLILHHSTFAVRQFKWVFMLSCIGDTFLSAVALVGEPYTLFAGNPMKEGGYMLIVPNGWFSGRHPGLDHIAMTLFCVAVHTNVVLVVCQFVWRNSLICGEHSFIKVRKVTGILPILWCTPQIAIAVWCWIADHDEKLNELGLGILQENGWHLGNHTASPFPSLIPGNALKTRVHHIFNLSSSTFGYAIMIYCQFGVLRFLRMHGVPSNHKTLRAYAEVNRALIALALTPIVSIGPVIAFSMLLLFEVPLNGAVSAYLTLALLVITVANPLVTILFVRNYREGLLGMIRKRKAVTAPTQTCDLTGMSELTAVTTFSSTSSSS